MLITSVIRFLAAFEPDIPGNDPNGDGFDDDGDCGGFDDNGIDEVRNGILFPNSFYVAIRYILAIYLRNNTRSAPKNFVLIPLRGVLP